MAHECSRCLLPAVGFDTNPREAMSSYFRAVAIDYDGTLTHGRCPSDEVLEALAAFRADHRYVVLVTGRILEELLADFPDAVQHFDALVTENGAVVWHGGLEKPVVPPVASALVTHLQQRGVHLRQGRVILALDAQHDAAVRGICVSLGLDAQLVRNREALMVLPAGVTKATGLREALCILGVSYHSTVGIGDAENDLALLQACELGVAVGNAVPSLKAMADYILPDQNGAAVARFVREQIPGGMNDLQPSRRRVPLGITEAGGDVTIPASRAHVFVDGPTGSGKSYVAGLFIEALAEAGYTVCVLDFEGDHGALGHELRGMLALGGAEPLPTVDEVGRIIKHRFSSVVLNLSLRNPALRCAYARDVITELTAIRAERGLPHWIIVEEAHMVEAEVLELARSHGNLCLVTYHPDWLPESAMTQADVLITMEGGGWGRVALGPDRQHSVRFRAGAREVAHVRHMHKYGAGAVAYERGFSFRGSYGEQGPHVTTLPDFCERLATVPDAMILHHAAHRDFSRWVRDVFQDRTLAASLRRLESECRPGALDDFRSQVQDLIQLRYDFSASAQSA